MDTAKQHMAQALQKAALAAAQHVRDFTNGKQEKKPLPLEIKNQRVKKIDISADDAFRKTLNKAPVEFHGIDAEGGKEAHPDKLGEAMPLSIGIFGKGKTKASFVLDVVEGTTAAAHNHPNAISIAGISKYNSIIKVPENPKTGKTHIYYRKLFAPSAFRSTISIEKSPEENLKKIMKVAKIPASQITVTAMNRQANSSIIQAAQKLGTQLILIEAGDLLWGLKALLSDPEKPIIAMGRGGAEEGAITQIAAHALHATGQLQAMEHEENRETVDKTVIWETDDYVKAERNMSSVIFSAITLNTLFDLNKTELNSSRAESVCIDYQGLHKISQKNT